MDEHNTQRAMDVTDPLENRPDHPDYPLSDWQYDVASGYTRRGYREWVAACRERDEGMSDDKAHVVVHLRGGIVQNIDASCAVDVTVIDYDVEPDDGNVEIDGEQAWVSRLVEPKTTDYERIRNQITDD